MIAQHLYSLILELCATKNATLPATTGHLAHALFLNLVKQVDPALATRLHNEPNYRPFTVSPLSGAREQDGKLSLREGHLYRLRMTLLDSGQLWQSLSTYFLEAHRLHISLSPAEFTLQRVLSTPTTDQTNWAAHRDWQTLASTKPLRTITMHFASPTAFSIGNRRFALFPEPSLIWDSLMRTWNLYAPEVLRIEKLPLREFVKHSVVIEDYVLHSATLRFPKYPQKGFVGSCTYEIQGEEERYTSQIATLAQFAKYAGIGYKTTMGMGQVRIEEEVTNKTPLAHARGGAVMVLSGASRAHFQLKKEPHEDERDLKERFYERPATPSRT